jgi:hypothetical protein
MVTRPANTPDPSALSDWEIPGADSRPITALHFFEYFDPTDSVYLHAGMLPEKIEEWFALHHRNNQNQQWNEQAYQDAADIFLQKFYAGPQSNGKSQPAGRDFVLNYILHKADKGYFNNAFLYLYHRYIVPGRQSGGSFNITFHWARLKAGPLQAIQLIPPFANNA